jgi:solute carrier family 35 (UDP-sugar transporter), member A1/2/3
VRKPLEALRVAPPALLYLVQNNILFVALKNLKAPVFQVTYQSKLVTTALVSVVLLGRKYHGVQWLALVLLGVGVAVVVLGEAGEAPKEASEEASDQSIPLGLIAVSVACLSSAFAGVYFEKVLKGSTTSLWMRNVQLAFISVCLSLAQTAVLGSSENAQGNQRAFLEGFDGVAWTLVCLQAFGGLLVAAIVKYADNVVKGLATGVSVVFATTLSVLFLGTALTINFVVGAVVILASVWVFSNHKRALEIVGRRE